ncbi:methylated-DNA--[protein]-cysteine S-methyltransferase [Sphingobium sp. EM0848]|uniref:methylated-DNA--[protein]-cysteine S-methyltransferase n=1 Tax=Sphingobium sp. EM0848 TaxID=2743473 RepID=UPI00159C5623|nr:methylated-DNA--[protein]-cysteine S-methyltransferase [Sphingobium sp. EM0848]
MRGTPFQRSVWEKLLTIPAGETATYTDLANKLSPLSHPRAVASACACAANPIVLAVPCHRMVRSSGDLVGYR